MVAISRGGSCAPKKGTQSRPLVRFQFISHGRPVGCVLAQMLEPSYSWPTWGCGYVGEVGSSNMLHTLP